MEKTEIQKIQPAQHGTKLPTPLNQNLVIQNETGECYLSHYSGPLTTPVLVEQVARIKATFPALPAQFYAIFANRVKEISFGNTRLIDAVNHVIDNCVYPSPTIAQFLSFDKKIRLFTYPEMLDKVNKNGALVWQLHEKRNINGITYWTEKN